MLRLTSFPSIHAITYLCNFGMPSCSGEADADRNEVHEISFARIPDEVIRICFL